MLYMETSKNKPAGLGTNGVKGKGKKKQWIRPPNHEDIRNHRTETPNQRGKKNEKRQKQRPINIIHHYITNSRAASTSDTHMAS